ncbi:hypothetical protein AGABI1DRAFT_120944 [Agaricus bisporus var. burnettii JB137-S8]|uniref:Uncharacterized protein n=1 Tax=Agaricus bisporus var. burnettii (strain JB137-S8 / ATCC MYA-4627 / FGSC 10392) TaxID=597362 RepID=K5X8T6_AGABU|nr:uncharacterized protein AGABI1DRAFT_120944 [Agaricus bisporus var. burnettii JB137-S8]EKM79598.1 hypothetical protein AGABI1DRAFT_120944 [Agaricus bisporus var. burnettii JB137-S8]
MAEPQPQPLVCVFLKLPPSPQSVPRIHEIAWNVFLPQLDRLNDAFEAAQITHLSPEAKKIWLDARRSAAKKMSYLRDVTYLNYDAAGKFLAFVEASHLGRNNSKAYDTFQTGVYHAIRKTRTAQEVLLKFREDIRIVVNQITTLISDNGKDVSSFTSESSQSMLEIATAVEECNAILEGHREELEEVQRQKLDENDNPPSEAEFQMVEEKWLMFRKSSGAAEYRWQVLEETMQEPKDNDKPPTTSNNPTTPAMPTNSSKRPRVPFWRKFFRHVSSCFSVEKFVR